MMALSFDSSDGGVLSVDSHRVVPAPFLTKTYQLVDDPASNDIVSWGEDGSTFVVWRPPEFARDLLPNYFKHNNFSSFVRQLNTYGFRKVVPDRWEFANDFFRKGERHLLCEIHRRKAQQTLAHLQHYGSSLSPSTSGEDPQVACTAAGWSPLSSPLHSPRGICSGPNAATSISLSDENERLRRDNCLLLSELARLQKLYDDALLFLQHNMHMRVGTTTVPANMDESLRLNRQQQQVVHSRNFQLNGPHESPEQQHKSHIVGGKTVAPDAAAPRASTIDFVDGKLREFNGVPQHATLSKSALCNNNNNNINNISTIRMSTTTGLPTVEEDHSNADHVATKAAPGPRLFGVVLHGRKRLHPDQQQPAVNNINQQQLQEGSGPGAIGTTSSGAAAATGASLPPPSKSAKIELDLMPAAATEAPWLGFRVSRDERVCI